MTTRQAHLLIIDAIERRWNIEPRTAELRSWYKSVKSGRMSLVENKQAPVVGEAGQ
jgi:hypothetical protein